MAKQDSSLALTFVLLRERARATGSPMGQADAGLERLARERVHLSPRIRDSLWHAAGIPTHLTAAQQDSFAELVRGAVGRTMEHVATGLDRAWPQILVAVILIMAVVAAIPVFLIGVTWRWFVLRRRIDPGTAPKAAA